MAGSRVIAARTETAGISIPPTPIDRINGSWWQELDDDLAGRLAGLLVDEVVLRHGMEELVVAADSGEIEDHGEELPASIRMGQRITGMTSYLDVETLFPRFGLPAELTD